MTVAIPANKSVPNLMNFVHVSGYSHGTSPFGGHMPSISVGGGVAAKLVDVSREPGCVFPNKCYKERASFVPLNEASDVRVRSRPLFSLAVGRMVSRALSACDFAIQNVRKCCVRLDPGDVN